MNNKGFRKADQWFKSMAWVPLPFQYETWEAFNHGKSGMVNAPTGSGKTYSILVAAFIEYINSHPDNNKTSGKEGLQLIWVTPIKALAKEILLSCDKAILGMNLPWKAEIRTGDTTIKDRKSQTKNPPQILITTPESLHVILATDGYSKILNTVKTIVVDEWHELIGSKRGVQTELVVSKFFSLNPKIKIWGISATIGNMPEAIDVLLSVVPTENRALIIADMTKTIALHSVIPDEIERYPWAGHLGLKLADKVLHILNGSKTSLIFTNTRAQCEIWYQKLLEMDPDLAGQIAMHHGSISKEIREWVEEALYEGKIKAVVCTSSLDLGVDFRPVETIIQIGSPKGVSRFIQRAGRSGHQPGASSHIWFVPTHALELVEAAGLRLAMAQNKIEDRVPYIRSFDVLIQYLMTLAVSEGFYPDQVFHEIKKTFCFASTTHEEWRQILNYLLMGGDSLKAYDEYKKVEITGDGKYIVQDKRKALKHKLSIGTIVSDAMINIKLLKGSRLGVIEEWFVSQLSPGDVFWFAGRALELVRIKDMTAQVRPSQSKTGKIPSYMGGRMPLSSQMSEVLKEKIYSFVEQKITDKEIEVLIPLFEMQMLRSTIPKRDEFLVEYFESKDGFHLLMYPFEGRNVHEGMAALIAKRLSMIQPISFSIAMNDLGFELLSDQPLDVEMLINRDLFTTKNLASDILSSINNVEMAKRKFRDIARISGLIFTGFPGKQKKERHLQASSQLIFEVFREYEPDNLLYLQTYDEVMTFQLEESRMRKSLNKITDSHILISRPTKATPFSFPIIVDRLREKLTSEKLEARIKKMTAELLK
ncbi:MAG: ligase-associated DNA damage response DEXH box helicase [Saprospiraceae bacterium]|jgi:ATP-dependent Lhr-like helicase|nr:ligase-associated DNA damage response DEXH box helicase [Saprospiraceae bacterium]MBP9196580.1 ligase-associated DNA damage response DEXH box helicase [Saprospiraceae bacterium]